MNAPHGGKLVCRLTEGEARAALLEEARGLVRVPVDARVRADLELLAVGALSPLEGFLEEADYRSVVADMRLANGLVWPLPVTLGADGETARQLRSGQRIALVDDHTGRPVAVQEVRAIYEVDPEAEAAAVYRTTEEAHPGVAALYRQGRWRIGGPVWVLERQILEPFGRYALTPSQTRAEFARRGWETIVGFQTRNPVHRAHEYIQKSALEIVDGLLLHPLVGETKADDVPAAVRLRCYEVLVEGYYPRERVVLAVLPAAMRYAGPREAIFHALLRKNYGCTHFIVGRDHAGVGNYYGTYDAQRIFDRFRPEEIGITILKYEHTFYCRRCGGMASTKTCPHPAEAHVVLSGSRVRELLRAGQDLPPEFTRPEVAAILREAFAGASA